MIKRIFHPVGQGAFYSERHTSCNINIVYDCGTTNPSLLAKQRVVSQSFGKNDVIHILFISHFDKDHISLIDTLKNAVKKIERVVIPLLHDEEKIFLSNIYKALGHSSSAKLVSNPHEFFGGETKIIEIQPSSDTEIEESPPLDVSERGETRTTISSGTPLTISGLNDWVYIPFNYDYENRNKQFLDELQKEGIDVDRLREEPNYILEEKEKIRKVYKRKEINGNINENSMFLYSGPSCKKIDTQFWKIGCFYDYCFRSHFDYFSCHCHHHPHRVACLYTGDGNLNIVDIRKIYRRYWGLIGTIQIPHHGSWKSFKANALNNGPFLCPISVGNKNSYGHPSPKVICDILLKRSFPILVTEDSTFEEYIHE
ncbi:hypothetical protein [Porphyromonas gingivalis]|uniref:hypothetical protein n=1 Tax=Porphyromonas gingivalis TaxID=837 RepID=UPI0002FC7743|nr:hypothetical protein [Porphyromonas gingivalis]AUR47870.1 beta-lactamase [Porphyromonas gingivalis]